MIRSQFYGGIKVIEIKKWPRILGPIFCSQREGTKMISVPK